MVTNFSGNEKLPGVLQGIGERYREIRKYQKACDIYKYVVEHWPESEEALYCQSEVVKSYALEVDDANAEAALAELFARFSGHEKMGWVVHELAFEYRSMRKWAESRDLFRYFLEHWPDDEGAMKAQRLIAKASIRLGDDPNTEAAIDKLASDFSSNTELPAALNTIAEIYEGLKKYEEARGFYEQVIEQAPDSLLAQKAEGAIRKVAVLSLEDSGADTNSVSTIIDKLVADFNDRKDFADAAAFDVAAEWYYNKRYSEAIRIWEFLWKNEELASDHRDEIPMLLATCYREIKDYPKAAEYYKLTIEHYPASPYGWHAPYQLAHLYRDLGKFQEAIYWFRKQRELFSVKTTSEHALFWEGRTYFFDLKDYETATEVFVEYLQKSPESDNVPWAMHSLAVCYDKMGDKAAAIEMLEVALREFPDCIYAIDIAKKLEELKEEK